jgi:hypothetical protein
MVLEQEFAGSEADYSTTPMLEGSISHEETTTVPTPVAEAEERQVEEQVNRAESAEPAITSFATAPADTAAEALSAAPSATEPPRPRRSGWWQRARASVIGK